MKEGVHGGDQISILTKGGCNLLHLTVKDVGGIKRRLSSQNGVHVKNGNIVCSPSIMLMF